MYQLSKDGQAIVDRARKVSDQTIGPSADRTDAEGVFPTASMAALGDAGLMGLTVAEEFGGMGQGLRVVCAVLDEVAQRCASSAMVYLMHLCGTACYASASDKSAEWLRNAAKGRHLSTLAWSERGSRSHFWAPVSQEVRRNGGVEVNADKSWVTSAGYADGYVVSTRSAGGKSGMESTLYMVRGDDKGVTVAGPWDALGMRGNASAPMSLEGVQLGPDRALTNDGKGLEMMLGIVLPVFQLGNAAIAVGIAEATVEATRKHLTQSRLAHLDQKLADLPNLRARLGQMRIETDRARAHLASVVQAVEDPGPSTQLLVLEAKASASEAAVLVTEIGMRACGGAAFSKHLGVERYFRDARAAIVMAPTTDHAHEFIGRALCGMEIF